MALWLFNPESLKSYHSEFNRRIRIKPLGVSEVVKVKHLKIYLGRKCSLIGLLNEGCQLRGVVQKLGKNRVGMWHVFTIFCATLCDFKANILFWDATEKRSSKRSCTSSIHAKNTWYLAFERYPCLLRTSASHIFQWVYLGNGSTLLPRDGSLRLLRCFMVLSVVKLLSLPPVFLVKRL